VDAAIRRVCFGPDPNPKKPRLAVPPGAWDTHFHLYGPETQFPFSDVREYLPAICPVEHYLAVASVWGFERGVVVAPTFYKRAPDILLDAVRKTDGRLRGMICADPDMDAARIKELRTGGIRGIRMELRRTKPDFDEAVFLRTAQRAADASWVVALHVEPDSIVRYSDLIRRLPGQTVIENFALMDARLGLEQPALRTLVDLAGEPHIWLKTASAYRMLRKGASYDQVIALARVVHSASPDRTIWGTDWPHPGVFKPGQMPADQDLIDMLLDFVPDETVRRKLLVDNPKRLFDSD
jgi:predicted TIM-barrel fold metal-dependent hydrolase